MNFPCVLSPQCVRLASGACVVASYSTPEMVRVPALTIGKDVSAPHGIDFGIVHHICGDTVFLQPEFVNLKHAMRLTAIADSCGIEIRLDLGNSAKEIRINPVGGRGFIDEEVDIAGRNAAGEGGSGHEKR